MATTEYEVKRNDAGELQEVKRVADGVVIPIDSNSQEFCEFLTWASQQEPRVATEPYKIGRSSSYFAKKEALVAHCKSCGFTIYTKHFPSLGYHEIPRSEIIHAGPHAHAFYSLLQAAGPAGDEKSYEGVVPIDSGRFVTQKLFEELQTALQDENDDIRRLSNCPIDRCFVYIDISDFSKYVARQEVLIINSIVGVFETRDFWDAGTTALPAWKSVEGKICIGDGYIFVLKDPLNATYFAAYLACLIEVLVARKIMPVSFHFRMGVHYGPVYCFWDPGRKDWNYIGDGINGGQRVLSAIGKETDDVLFISGQVREALTSRNNKNSPYPEILASLQNRGRRADKHGTLWRVYEVNHTGLIGLEMAPFVETLTRNKSP